MVAPRLSIVPARYSCAFVFSGGGNLGSIQVGMLRALLEAGITPDLLVGSSVGALNAAFMACGPTLERLDTLERVWRGLRSSDIFVGSRRSQLAHLLRRHDHLHDSSGLAAIVKEHIRVDDLSQLPVHLEVATTDLHEGEARWWSSGAPALILCASAALPGIFPPMQLDGHLHVDGGVLAPIPVQRAIDLGASTIWVLDVGAERPVRIADKMHALEVFMASFATSRRKMALAPVPVPDGVVVHQLPFPEIGDLGRTDFSTSGRLLDEAYALTRDHLDGLALTGGGLLASA
ncbi:MAG TPA: patatin-like phospholipase family protein [Acidimicrobiia bacterium]|nr:patatin-like phospholipase family protein [Acidimicrobiia bacterium]